MNGKQRDEILICQAEGGSLKAEARFADERMMVGNFSNHQPVGAR